MKLSGRERVEFLLHKLLLPVRNGGLVVEPGGWCAIQHIKEVISTLGKRPVSVDYLTKMMQQDEVHFELDDEVRKVRLKRIKEQIGDGYVSPPEIVYASASRAGLEQAVAAHRFDGCVQLDAPGKEGDIVIVIHARRAEGFGAKFYPIQDEPRRLRAEGVQLDCMVVKAQI